MPKFVFAYHGGGKPETEEEGAKVMAAWQAWLGCMGDGCVDMGAPVGLSKTVSAEGVADDGGSNPLSGYTIVEAADIDAAVAMAKGCPILDGGAGTVEVAPIMEM
ncbi:YciI family protein [uncultured Roseovarius sp.]|uniref:YciI family protein n=1 Tax=uncultured Roseovarius sp. TaxID=293344 RepID=UPI002608CF77|nr:YciI family protein [uncultured Roseovarius sp.]